MIGYLMIMRVTSVEQTQLGQSGLPPKYVALYTSDMVSTILDAKRHASLLSSFLLESPLSFGDNEINGFQKLSMEFRQDDNC